MLRVLVVFFFNDTATTEIYTLSLHDALPICSFMSLALLEPGVAANYDPTPGWASTYFTISVGGSGAPESVVTVDGASTRERLSGATQNFSQESVQEFQISTFNFDLSTSGAYVGSVN